MNKQNQTFIVSNHSRPYLHGYHVDDNISKKLVISQSSELGGALFNSVEVEQRKSKQVLQKEYDARSIRYANEDYSYLANVLLSRFSQLDAAATIATQYPLFKMLRGVTKKFMFNELEIIFFLHTIEEQKWRYDDQLISDFQAYFKQDFLSNQENQNVEGFKKLLLFLICCGYTIKCFFNDSNDQEIILITDHIQQYCQKDFKKSLLELWRQKHMNCSLKIVPRVLNKLYNKLMRIPKDGKQELQQDYNALVDQIIQISPAYNSQEAKQIKQEVKPIQQQPQQQTSMNYSQQSYQPQPFMNNSGLFMNFSQSQNPQQNQQTYFQPFPSQDFIDPNFNENLFGNTSKNKEEMPPPPPPLVDSISRLENKIRHFKSDPNKQKKIVFKYQQQLGMMLNQKAESDLQQNKLESCYYHLQKAQQICLLVPNLKLQTINNLALYHQKLNQPQRALNYLNQALKMQYSQNLDSSLANTYLNISAIQSSLECHDVALQNIYLSIILLQHELLIEGLKCNIELQNQLNLQRMQSNLLSQGTNFQFDEYLKIDRAQILIAAYHNLSLEMEFFKRNEEAQKIIQSAKTLSEFILQPTHALRIKLKEISEKQVSTRIQKVQNLNHRSISFDDRNSNSIRHTKSSKYHFQRQFSKDNNNSIQSIQNPNIILKNTPSKLLQHQKFITEITQSKSSQKINKSMNPLELSYTQD